MPRKPSEPNQVFTLAEAFIVSKRAQWGHDEWEKLLKEEKGKVEDLKDEEDEEAKRNLGNITEGGKFFYEAANNVEVCVLGVPARRPKEAGDRLCDMA